MCPSRGCIGFRSRLALALLCVGEVVNAVDSASAEDDHASESAVPRFRWGQTKEKLFLTAIVKDLDKTSVRLSFHPDRLSFEALDSFGKTYALELDLVQDIVASSCKWEHVQRRDQRGDAVLVTLLKLYPYPWDALVLDPPAAYRSNMDRDWAREDQALEQPEEDAFFVDHEKYLPRLTSSTLERALEDVDILVLMIRHVACKQCKVVDETFAAAAKTIADAKKGSWQQRLRLAVVDPRTAGRLLARDLGGFCGAAPTECRHFTVAPAHERELFAAGGLEPILVRGRHSEAPLLADLKRLARPQFTRTTAASAHAGRTSAAAGRGLVVLPPVPAREVALAAHRARLWMDVCLAEDISEAGDLGLSIDGGDTLAAVWQPGEEELQLFGGGGVKPGAFTPWLLARAVPLLANTSTFEEDEPYEDLGLPVARLFVSGTAAEAAARAAVRDVAAALVGRVAFLARNATAKIHEWRQHGLPPRRFPAFGLALSMRHNATKFAFLEGPRPQPGASLDDAMVEFWQGPARSKLQVFLHDALTGKLEPSRMSDAPPEEEGVDVDQEAKEKPGRVRIMVGRTCKFFVEASPTDGLVEVHDEWRRDHAWRTLRLDLLSPMLWRSNITVYRMDFGYNECPPEGLPLIPAGYSGYYFVPRMAKERGKKWQKMKKLDPPFDRVLSFLVKHAEVRPKLNVEALLLELETAAKRVEQIGAAKGFVSDGRRWAASAGIGLGGLLAFLWLRRRRRPPSSPPAPGAADSAAPEGSSGSSSSTAAGTTSADGADFRKWPGSVRDTD